MQNAETVLDALRERGYKTRTVRRSPQTTGPGRASQVPVATIPTFRAHYAGESFGAAIQALHPFHGLRRDTLGSALPLPPEDGCSNGAAGFA
jgi:hypothetical protein